VASVLRVTAVVASAVLVLGGGYAVLDARDLVPGVLTMGAPWPTPSAFPDPAVAADAPDPVLGDLDPAAPLPSGVQDLVDAVVRDTRLGPSVGVVVQDQLTGQVLGSSDAAGLHQPASTAKLVTAVAALTALDPEATFTTSVVLDGSTLVLVGGGDVMLSDGAGDPAVVDGRAGLGDLAAQVAGELATRGITSVSVGVDDTLFTGPSTSPGWDPEYVTDGFVAPVSPIEVHIGKTDPSKEYSLRVPDPSIAAAQAFAQRLTELGVTVTGAQTRATAPAGAAQVGAVESAPVRQVVSYFLHTSDNTVTEAMARMVALAAGEAASFDGATAAVLQTVATLGVDTSGAHLTDASGLAEGSGLSAQLLAGLVQVASSSDHPELRDVIVELPIAGLTGTLVDRYLDSAARGLVRAKTGSLSGVTSLAGVVVDRDGRALSFAVVADQTTSGQWGARGAIDSFITGLAACGS
jgi:serine-type D-Ala-D-Ala carboxypeptidase/endopeptidase (penicillin-binding protein 4)